MEFPILSRIINRRGRAKSRVATAPAVAQTGGREVRQFEIAENDPLLSVVQSERNPIRVDKLTLDSPALKALKEANVKIAVPLVSQGELIGLLNLGPRLSEQEYSADDHGLLSNLASQAAPALRVAQLVRERQREVLALERMQQEMRVARLIQQTLLPKQVPNIPGWELAVHYQPARDVGGDFYDFFSRQDGRIVLVVGDVTDKGVPAALVMATTRAILRGAARRMLTPSAALRRSNNLLCPEIPPNMFVTCLYAILDPNTGHLAYANAGHDLPIHRSNGQVTEFRATGMPLGLLPDMEYEEKEGYLAPGDSLLLYSDGLVEAHNPEREMFGFPRLKELIAGHGDNDNLIEFLLGELGAFTGADWEQEDDVTLLTLARCDTQDPTIPPGDEGALKPMYKLPDGETWRSVVNFSLPSEPGNEREAIKIVGDALQEMGVPADRLERLLTAIAEATMNAMEHGNKYQVELPVSVRVFASDRAISVFITDRGGERPIPTPETPDLASKLAGQQSPRGWGLFLMKNLVDELHTTSDDQHHTVQLILNLKEQENPHTSP